jgi:hypothetical protein
MQVAADLRGQLTVEVYDRVGGGADGLIGSGSLDLHALSRAEHTGTLFDGWVDLVHTCDAHLEDKPAGKVRLAVTVAGMPGVGSAKSRLTPTNGRPRIASTGASGGGGQRAETREEALRATFALFDHDNSGTIIARVRRRPFILWRGDDAARWWPTGLCNRAASPV